MPTSEDIIKEVQELYALRQDEVAAVRTTFEVIDKTEAQKFPSQVFLVCPTTSYK